MKTSAALLASLLPLSAAAAASGAAPSKSAKGLAVKPCVRKKGKAFLEPATLADLMQCQSRNMLEFIEGWERKTGEEPPDALVDKYDNRQRAEVRDYLRRHPHRASVNLEPSEVRQGVPTSGEKGGGSDGGGEDSGSMDGGVKRGYGPPEGGGVLISPQIAQEIAKNIAGQRGSMSPELKGILDSIKRDGPNLSDETLEKLKRAASAAKADGLSLNVPDNVEKALLETGGKPPEATEASEAPVQAPEMPAPGPSQ